MAAEKRNRKRRIIHLIQSENLSTQDEVLAVLKQDGFEATQASISRDLKELGIIKKSGFYSLPDVTVTNAPTKGLDSITVKPTGDSLIVVHCAQGLAQAVALTIDHSAIPEIAGTIAGDDTIFIAVPGRGAQKKTIEKLGSLFRIEKML